MRHLKQVQHTPGPWDVSIGPPDHLTKAPRAIKTRIVRGPLGIGEGIIATVEYSVYGAKNADEAEANAALISAAPDLLAALKALEDAVCKDMDNKFDDAESYACIEQLEMTRAAIAKAEGRKP